MALIIAVICCLILFFFGNLPLFATVYALSVAFLLIRLLISSIEFKTKIYIGLSYCMILAIQELYNVWILFKFDFEYRPNFLEMSIGLFLLILPFLMERIMLNNNRTGSVFPSVNNITTMTFQEIRRNKDYIIDAANKIRKLKKSTSKDNIEKILETLPEHNSFRYINKGHLTDEYFKIAENSMSDPHLYIVISNTESPQSQLLSVFTQRSFNHVSISFDRDLKTVISYNGGENVYPPGLNFEMVEFFHKTENSSVIVYRLNCTADQKRIILKKINDINEKGSSYNMLGLVLKFSFKPNIMFCSQFVYAMLKEAGLEYFKKKEADVKPTDFVEQDYYRKLEYDYSITFC